MVINTEHFIIIPPSEEDFKHLEELYNDPAVMQYIPNSLQYWDARHIKEKVLKYQDGNIGIHIVKSHDNEIIGEASIFHFNAPESYEIGFIIHKNYWGQGLGTLICSSLINYCLESLKAKNVMARIIKNNIVSQKVCIKSGMTLLDETFEDKKLNRLTFSIIK